MAYGRGKEEGDIQNVRKLEKNIPCADRERTPADYENVMAILGEFQHALLVAYIDKRKIRNVVRKTCTERRKISLLKDLKVWKRFLENVVNLVRHYSGKFVGTFHGRDFKGML